MTRIDEAVERRAQELAAKLRADLASPRGRRAKAVMMSADELNTLLAALPLLPEPPELSPEQYAEMENLDGPLSRGQLHPAEFYQAIRQLERASREPSPSTETALPPCSEEGRDEAHASELLKLARGALLAAKARWNPPPGATMAMVNRAIIQLNAALGSEDSTPS